MMYTGGKTQGRQKQRYILLKRNCKYVIAHHSDVAIAMVCLFLSLPHLLSISLSACPKGLGSLYTCIPSDVS